MGRDASITHLPPRGSRYVASAAPPSASIAAPSSASSEGLEASATSLASRPTVSFGRLLLLGFLGGMVSAELNADGREGGARHLPPGDRPERPRPRGDDGRAAGPRLPRWTVHL